MKINFIAVALMAALAFTGNADATGKKYECWDVSKVYDLKDCPKKPEPPKPEPPAPTNPSQGQGQNQGQGQGQGQSQGQTANGGNGGNGGAGGAGGQGGQGGVGHGGQGGDGGQGGKGGDQSQGQSSTNLNLQGQNTTVGQGQSNDNSGNSTNDLSVRGGDQSVRGGDQSNSVDSRNSVTGGDQSQSNAVDSRNSNAVRGGDQSQANSVDSSNSNAVRGGDQVSDASNSGGNSQVAVDASDKSVTNIEGDKTMFIPAVVPSSPAATLGVGNVTAIVGTCGPLQTIVKTPIVGTYVGLVKKSSIQQGYDEALAPYTDASGAQVDYREIRLADGSIKLMGHQPTTFVTVVGVAAARNIALGGGSGSGDWGQAGGGSSSSVQQLVTRVQLRECEVGTLVPVTKRVGQ